MLVSRLVRFGLPGAFAASILVIALHAALLPEAHWQGDEYLCAAFARDLGLRYLWQARIAGWSPRPFSELLYYAFCREAAAAMRPLAAPFLGLLWTMLLATTLATARRGDGFPLRALAGLVTFALFLAGHPIAEMFYWPAGAVAYIPTLAGTSLALFLLLDGRSTSLGGACALSGALAATAASSESGAIAALLLAAGLAAMPAPRAHAAVLLLPSLLIAGFVFWMLAQHRLVSGEAAAHAPSLRRMLQSMQPVPRTLLGDIVTLWPARLLFVLGLRWCWQLARAPVPQGPVLPGFAAAIMLAAGATIGAGMFQFGAPCCQRHDSLRQAWVILALAALAIWSARWPTGGGRARFGPLVLMAAGLVALAAQAGPLRHDFRLMPAMAATNHANWRAGRDISQSSMIFRLSPAGELTGGPDIPPGTYAEPARNSWSAHGIMLFFGKRSIVIRQPDENGVADSRVGDAPDN